MIEFELNDIVKVTILNERNVRDRFLRECEERGGIFKIIFISDNMIHLDSIANSHWEHNILGNPFIKIEKYGLPERLFKL